jgi:cyclic pyranopterin phosphate synthase
MVDVSEKKISAQLWAKHRTSKSDKSLQSDIQTKKDLYFKTAIIAGIMAAKKTGELIPYVIHWD